MINNIALTKDGGAAQGTSIMFFNCTIKYNSASNGNGGVLRGGGDFEDCVLIGNYATNGGAAFAIATTTLTRCVISDGGASLQGAAVYSEFVAIEVCDSQVRGFAASASGGGTALMFMVAAFAQFDRVTWSNNELGAVASTDDAAIVLRNNEGLATTDAQDAALLGCDAAGISEYCALEYCTNALPGITCECFPDGVKTDPNLGVCSSSGEMSSLVLGSEQTQLLSLKKDEGNATTSLFFPNTGDVFISWGLAVSKNAEGLKWTLSSTNGTLAAGKMQEVMLSLDMKGLQARATEYITEFTLNVSSPTPTPSPISSTTTVVVRNMLSAAASATASFVNDITNGMQRAAGDSIDFKVIPVDATGMTILDPTEFAYFGVLTHVPSNTSVSCRVGYDSVSGSQLGGCDIPSTVCVGSDNCEVRSAPMGAFTLEVNDAKGEMVGATRSSFIVASCPAAYYDVGGTCVSCPSHVECSPGSSISDWVLDAGYWRADDESDDVRECRFFDVSCPGNSSDTCTNSKWPYCACGYAGPTCAVCDAKKAGSRFYMAWTSGTCESCDESTSFAPTVGLVSALGVVAVLVAALVFTKRNRITSSRAYQLIHQIYRIGKVKASIIVYTFQVRP